MNLQRLKMAVNKGSEQSRGAWPATMPDGSTQWLMTDCHILTRGEQPFFAAEANRAFEHARAATRMWIDQAGKTGRVRGSQVHLVRRAGEMGFYVREYMFQGGSVLDRFRTYVSERYARCFNEGAEFFTHGPERGILVYEGGEFAAYLMPLRDVPIMATVTLDLPDDVIYHVCKCEGGC